MIVYISIGNSDDKLTQKEWSSFWYEVDSLIDTSPLNLSVHGIWSSDSVDPYQNACWCIEIDPYKAPEQINDLKHGLAVIASKFRQESIVWTQAEKSEFIIGNINLLSHQMSASE